MLNRYQHYNLEALKQMHRCAIDYANRKLSRDPDWLGSKSFHARMRTIRLLQLEIRRRENNARRGHDEN